RRAERRILEEVDREPGLAYEELRRRDVHRACGLEGNDTVQPTRSEVAEGEGERAHHPEPRGDADNTCDLPGEGRRGRALEAEDLHRLLGSLRAERNAVQKCARASLGRPLLP